MGETSPRKRWVLKFCYGYHLPFRWGLSCSTCECWVPEGAQNAQDALQSLWLAHSDSWHFKRVRIDWLNAPSPLRSGEFPPILPNPSRCFCTTNIVSSLQELGSRFEIFEYPPRVDCGTPRKPPIRGWMIDLKRFVAALAFYLDLPIFSLLVPSFSNHLCEFSNGLHCQWLAIVFQKLLLGRRILPSETWSTLMNLSGRAYLSTPPINLGI